MKQKQASREAHVSGSRVVAPRIELSVRLSDGSFETSVEMPTNASAEARDALVRAWFHLMERALVVVKEVAR